MRIKKMRGIKRRVAWALRQIEEDAAVFPGSFYGGLWHMHMPCLWQRATVSMARYRRDCIKILLRRLEYFLNNKPDDGEHYRVVVAGLPHIDDCQLMVFRGDSYYKEFFGYFDTEKYIKIEPNKEAMEYVAPGIIEYGCKIIGRQIANSDEADGVVWFVGEVPEGVNSEL